MSRRPARPTPTPAVAPAPTVAAKAPQEDTRGGEAAASAFLAEIRNNTELGKQILGLDPQKVRAALPHMRRSAKALGDQDFALAGREALAALDIEPGIALANHLAAVVMEKLGNFPQALALYERTLKLDPQQFEAYSNLGQLAWRMGMIPTAERFFRLFLKVCPDNINGLNNLAAILREQKKFSEATDLIRTALMARPDVPSLWNTMGLICMEAADIENSVTFYEEVLRLAPNHAQAHHNIGMAFSAMGMPEKTIEMCSKALDLGLALNDTQEARFARSQALIATGDLAQGWPEYEARLHPNFKRAMRFLTLKPTWQGEDLTGKGLIVMAEQGVGDEVMFLSMIGDLQKAVGPTGRLLVCTDKRLMPLVEKAYPGVETAFYALGERDGRKGRVPHGLNWAPYDYFIPMGSLMRHIRANTEAFPRTAYLQPDPARVAHWRAWIESLPGTLKVGAVLRSSLMTQGRSKFLPRLDELAPVFKLPGITWINLQYGDATVDFRILKQTYGVEMVTPPDIDLKDHLDDLSALCKALDLFVGPITATGHIVGAVGTRALLFGPPRIWMYMGTGGLPWYGSTEVFQPPRLGEWTPAMERLTSVLRTELAQAEARKAA